MQAVTWSKTALRRSFVVAAIALVIAPTTHAVPDAGFTQTARQITQEDFPLVGRSLPCNDEGILWNGLDNPVVAEAIRQVGSKVCDQLMLDAMVTLVETTEIVGADVHRDGELTVQIVFPLVKTPIMIPVRNQDLNSSGFVEDALAHAVAPAEEWVPYMLDLNKGVPCTEGWSGVPRDAIRVGPARTSVYAQTCGDPAIEPSPLVNAPGGIRSGDFYAIAPPRAIASVDRAFLLEVTGTAATESGVRTVYHAALFNVAFVHNTALETLAGLQDEVERQGARIEDTVLTVKIYLTEAQLASDDPVVAAARTLVPAIDEAKGIVIPLGTADGEVDTTGACEYTKLENAILLTYANGCLADSRANAYDPGNTQPYVDPNHEIREGYYERNVQGDDWIVVGQIEDQQFVNLPKLAARQYTSGSGTRVSVPFRVTGADAIRITTLWSLRGDVVRTCDPQGSHCVAGGATLGATLLVGERTATGHNTVAYSKNSLLYADPMFFCAADEPFGIPVYEWIQPFTGCFTVFLSDDIDHQVQAFNRQSFTQTAIIDVRQKTGWLSVLGQVHGSVDKLSETNIPWIRMNEIRFMGIMIEPAEEVGA